MSISSLVRAIIEELTPPVLSFYCCNQNDLQQHCVWRQSDFTIGIQTGPKIETFQSPESFQTVATIAHGLSLFYFILHNIQE